MQRHGCKTLVFSSSATVYGKPERLPIREDAPLSTTNPYGATKLMGENILRDLQAGRRRPGRSRCCATSTRWARTKAA